MKLIHLRFTKKQSQVVGKNCMKSFLIFVLVCSMPIGLLGHDRLKRMRVYQNSADFYNLGYGNPDGNTNGEKNLLLNALRSEDIVFDVGADIGDWSKHILAINNSASLYVFEPIPTAFKILQERLNFPNVRLYNLALSQEVGTADFFVYLGHSGLTDCSSLYYRPIIEHAFTEKITVETQNLNYFCKINNIDHIDLLKIDAEGAEWFIFLGAEELLNKKAITLIQFEYGGCNIDSQTTLQQMYELLTSKGYSVYRIVPDGLIEIHTWNPELENFQYSNYLASLNESHD